MTSDLSQFAERARADRQIWREVEAQTDVQSEGSPLGLLSTGRALVFNTSNASAMRSAILS